jgi:hypothetical protein
MKSISGYERARIAGLLALLFGVGGCIEYRIDTTLNADGSGSRHEEIIVDEDGDMSWFSVDHSVSAGDFQVLMHVDPDRWTRELGVEDDDTVHVLRRETRIRDLASWAEVSGGVRISGARPADAAERLGHLQLGDVQFLTSVRVESGQVPEGRSFTYRETFYWESLIDVLVEYVLVQVRDSLDAHYPGLNSERRGEIVGLVRGGLWGIMDSGILDVGGDEEEALVTAFADRTAEQVMRIVHRRYPEADEKSFSDMLRRIYDDEDDRLEDFIESKLPGVLLALNTEIVFRLNMPGRVTASNAHDRDGTTLIWEFSPADPATEPVEIFAESIVRR